MTTIYGQFAYLVFPFLEEERKNKIFTYTQIGSI